MNCETNLKEWKEFLAMPNTDLRTDTDRFCAGSKLPTNGLEERLDMLVAQLSVISTELHELVEAIKWTR